MNTNPYYNPETMGLKILGTLDEDLDYEFNTLVVWQETATKKLYYATDSGCSCPTPFEDYTTIDSLTPVNDQTRSNFENEVKNFPVSGPEKTELLALVARTLRD